jgi:hypothetical protein
MLDTEYQSLLDLIDAIKWEIKNSESEYKKEISKKRQKHKTLIADVRVLYYEGAK